MIPKKIYELENPIDSKLLGQYIEALKIYNGEEYEDEILVTENVELEDGRAKEVVECFIDSAKLILTNYFFANFAEDRIGGTQITIEGKENIATLLQFMQIDLTDKPNLLDNLGERLSDYGMEKGFEDSEDFKPLLNTLNIPFTERILN